MTNFAATLSDTAALVELGAAAERTRLSVNLSQQELAELAGVSKRTLERFEAGDSTTTMNLLRILRALGVLGQLDLVFPEPAASPLQQLREARSERRRASPRGISRGPSGAPARRRSGAGGRPAARPPADDQAVDPPFRWGDESPPG